MYRLSASCLFRNKWYRLLTNIAETSEMKFMHDSYNIMYLSGWFAQHSEHQCAVCSSAFSFCGRVLPSRTSEGYLPFFFSVTRLLVSLFLRFSQRGVHLRARCVRKNSNCSECLTCHHPPEMPVCPGHSHRSLGRLSISEHFDLVSTRCNRW